MTNSIISSGFYRLSLSAAAFLVVSAVTVTNVQAQTFGFGTTPTAAQIAAINIDVTPDGTGLPPGSGTGIKGEKVYAEKCSACHGDKLQGVKAAGGAALIGGRGTVGSDKPKRTVESYWPYATTLFDYVRRAMPLNEPGSLTSDEVYAVSAFIFSKSNIIKKDHVVDARSLPKIKMPNRDGFIPDPRPDVRNYQ